MRTLSLRFALVLLVAGCSGKEGVETPPSLTVTPDALDFGIVGVGGESTLTITLTNSGGGEVSLLSVTLIDGDTDDWGVDRNGVDSLLAGASGDVLVTFTPEDQQLYTGQVQLRTDYEAEPSWLVTLRGTGGPSDADEDGDGYSVSAGDCDDYNPYVHPGAAEVCNGVDDNCDGIRPAEENDNDGDGWLVCEGDCDDGNNTVHPNAPEICDQLDNDCDNAIPDNDDFDADGVSLCDGDCDDDDSRVNPGRAEVCDGVDNDCDGGSDNLDADGDGHSVCSAAGDCDDNDPNAFPVVVSTSGSQYGTGTDADPYDSLATAFANLDLVCRQVILEAGTYYDVSEAWPGGVVTVVGRTGGAADVVLEASSYERLFTVSGGSTLTLRDLTLRGGDAPDDGGAISVVNATVVLDGLIVSDNVSANDGGAVSVSSGTLTILGGTRFENNTAADDGGALVLDAATFTDVTGSSYVGNTGVRGGAIYMVGGSVTLRDSELRSNAATEGGAIAANGAGTYVLERNRLLTNDANADGGALALRDVSSASGNVRNNRVQDNTAQAGGGGIAVLGTTAAIRIANNTLTGNEAVGGEGGGILLEAASGAGVAALANVLHSNDGASAVYVLPGSGAAVSYNTVYLTNSGIHFAGDAGDGLGNPIDPTNVVRNPLLVAVSDDGNPDNDDLDLQAGSPEIDSGPPQAAFFDPDGSQNDRGWTGGPAAP